MADKEEGRISAGTLVLGAVGLALIFYGLSKAGGPKSSAINAKFNFNYLGPVMDVKFRVRFGKVSLGLFSPNVSLMKISDYKIPVSPTSVPIEYDVKVVIPAKEDVGYPLPFTYDGEAMILDKDGNLLKDAYGNDLKVVTTNVFTHTEDFEVVML